MISRIEFLYKHYNIKKDNNQEIGTIFMNPTGNYHMPLKSFIENNKLEVIMADSRISEHIRITKNLGKEKSDPEDASILMLRPINCIV